MGLLRSLLKTSIDVVTTPIDVVKDVASLGGVLDGEHESYTGKKLNKLVDDVEDIVDDLL